MSPQQSDQRHPGLNQPQRPRSQARRSRSGAARPHVPTIKDVAAAAGVSWKTVSNVVNDTGRVGEKTRARVQAVIEELGYQPSMAGRQLRRGRTGILGLAVPDIQSPYFSRLAHEVMDLAQRRSYRVIIAETSGDIEAERSVARGFGVHLLDGLLFSPLGLTLSAADQTREGTPTVLLGERPVPGATPLTTDHVAIDNVGAARDITGYVLSTGRRRLAFLGSEPSGAHRSGEPRLNGFLAALSEAGTDCRPRWLVPVDQFTRVSGFHAVTAAVDGPDSPLHGIDGLVCANDLLALGAIAALRRAGLRVPEDVAVTGWDDIEDGAYSDPALTTVSPDIHALAAEALDRLLARIDGSPLHPDRLEDLSIPYRVVVRASA